MPARAQTLLLILLTAGSAVNLAAGARRPLVERSILARGAYPAADRAAAAVRRLVPAGEPLAVVGYEGDVAEGLDYDVWIDYRLKWLLYPRRIDPYRVSSAGVLEVRTGYVTGTVQYHPSPELDGHRYVLLFRATQPPGPDPLPVEVLAADPMFRLLRVRGR